MYYFDTHIYIFYIYIYTSQDSQPYIMIYDFHANIYKFEKTWTTSVMRHVKPTTLNGELHALSTKASILDSQY